ncbi:hypothetical protein [Paenibacillus sp. FSL R10-2734]|uniref:hypothetical protein n=1 Tax=Paenibacillus sp. FSL R10-2734 TaxID=2954691 RepID=UPI0030DB56BC
MNLVFPFVAGKLNDHDDKNEQGNELINTHLRPPPIPKTRMALRTAFPLPRTLLRSPFTHYVT